MSYLLYIANGCKGSSWLSMCLFSKMFGGRLVVAFSGRCKCATLHCLSLLLVILVILLGIVGMDISNLVPRLGPHSPCRLGGFPTIMACVRTNFSLQRVEFNMFEGRGGGGADATWNSGEGSCDKRDWWELHNFGLGFRDQLQMWLRWVKLSSKWREHSPRKFRSTDEVSSGIYTLR